VPKLALWYRPKPEKILVYHAKDGVHGGRKRAIGLILELEEEEEKKKSLFFCQW
jgi:hypothetical protein